jgi:vacuolar-type H+-ATPase subunit H
MAEKIVTSIKEAEKSAKDTIENRKKQNLVELEEALAASKERLKSTNSSKQKSIQEAVEKADKDAKEKIDTLKSEYESRMNKLSDVAKDNLSESVKFIISNI